MDIKELLLSVHKTLKEKKIDHALIGAFAMAHYGIQRATGDIDFLIDEKNKNNALVALKELGFSIFYESKEVLQLEGPGNIDFLLAQRPLSREMLKDALPIEPLKIKCVSLEDIIGLKIQAYSNDPKRELKDKADILSILESNSDLDWEKIKQYADLFNAWDEIQSIREKVND